MNKISKILFFIVFMFLPSTLWAQSLSAPKGEVILKVDGKIGVTNQDDVAAFDIQMLQDLEVKTYETHTPWSENSYRFRGATLKSVLKHVDATEGSIVKLYALDGYQVEITWKDAIEYSPLLAYSRNNVPMSRRDRGPLWLVFPLDTYEALKDVRYDNFWVWQLARIEVK